MDEPVIDVLLTKQPEACENSAEILDTYSGRPPELVPLNLKQDIFTKFMWQLSGVSGLGDTDLVILKNWLQCFGKAIRELRLIVSRFMEWLSNDIPPCSDYC